MLFLFNPIQYLLSKRSEECFSINALTVPQGRHGRKIRFLALVLFSGDLTQNSNIVEK